MRRIVIACGVVTALILVGFLLRSRANTARAAPVVGAARPVLTMPALPHEPRGVGANVVVSSNEVDRDFGETHTPLEDPLTAYKRANQYPPTSRPLSIHHDIITPNRRYETAQHARKDSDVTFWFSADKSTIVGDDVLHPFLEVRRDGTPIDVRIVSATADQLPLELARQGERYLGKLRLAQTHYDAATMVTLRVEFEYGAGGTQVASFPVMYTPAHAIPARFNGSFREAVVNGSLVVYAGIEVKQPGWYLIDANLWAADDAPVAWTRYKGNLALGDTEVALEFFGKVLVDARSASPYQVRQLRGARHVEQTDPDLEAMPFFEGVYTTRAYPLDRFSPAEWDSAHKQEMIRLLTEQQRLGRHNPAAAGDEP